ncbi:MAG: glycoside hydrolase family 99-like domain-containing protein [Anaerolineaceae bacterium]|nr:glycoside hydrolase family 99-like domain-containing protein [Anaerolineaceae bacterium]
MKNQINEKNQKVNKLDQNISVNDNLISELRKRITEVETNLSTLEDYTSQREKKFQEINSKLVEIYGSSAWKIVHKFWTIRLYFVPKGSKRELLVKKILSLFSKVKNTEIIEGNELFDNHKNLDKQKNNVDTKILSTKDTKDVYKIENYIFDIQKYKNIYFQQLAMAIDEKDENYIEISDNEQEITNLNLKLIAFYLPQYHPIPENDEWWGKGFTEWTNVSKAVPQFMGHYQPHLPGELGFYDLRVPEVQRRQVELAKKYGIYGFCFYYYWFNGKKLLEQPLDKFISDIEIDFPFCLCWANENWTRRWDGLEEDILIEQIYSEENDLLLINDISKFFEHPNYIKIDGRPILIVYRAQNLPNPTLTAKTWRKYCLDKFIGNPYLVLAQTFGYSGNPNLIGFDAVVEFPPFGANLIDIQPKVEWLSPDFSGFLYDYQEVVNSLITKPKVDYQVFKTVMPSWDNTPRKNKKGSIFFGSTPWIYQRWLSQIIKQTKNFQKPEMQYVFINAWNEWGEGAYLEPDRKFGYAYLNATRKSLIFSKNIFPYINLLKNENIKKSNDIAVMFHLYYPELWQEFLIYLSNLDSDFDLFVSIPNNVKIDKNIIYNHFSNAKIFEYENRGRDIAPFLEIFNYLVNLDYKLICKLHTKRSTYLDNGDLWRKSLLDGIIGSKEIVKSIIDLFNNNSEIGMVCSYGNVLSSERFMGSNAQQFEKLINTLDIPYNKEIFPFISGSMFWFRPLAIYPFGFYNLKIDDFQTEIGQKDGTLAHAIERIFGLLNKINGYDIAESNGKEIKVTTEFLHRNSYPIL